MTGNIRNEARQETLVENTTDAPKKRMNFDELESTLRVLSNAGQEATLRHNDMFGEGFEQVEGEMKPHLPGMKPGECSVCDEVVFPFDEFMRLEKEYLGVSGIPLPEVLTNIRMIRSIIKMIEEEKHGNSN